MTTQFIVTKEHRRFTEFADTVKTNTTIGICYGQAGTGKTLSARRYAAWDQCETLLTEWGQRQDSDAEVYQALAKTRTVLYTPAVAQTTKQFREDIDLITNRVGICVSQHPPAAASHRNPRKHVQLIIVDEAERLSPTCLEILRDHYDRSTHGLILIGMPGLEKQFTRYPQFYSRVGFAHQYRPLSNEELVFVLNRQWQAHGRTLDTDDFTDAQAITAIAQLTRGNFRLLERLLTQIERVLQINELHIVTNDVVEAARSTLVIGIT